MINKILVATDGSKSARKALEWGLDLADKYSAKIFLVNVVRPVHMPYGMYAAEIMQEHLQETINNYKKLISNLIKKAKEIKPNVEISGKVEEGYPSDTIVDIAEKENFDIIIMGSRGLSKIKRLFLGSVSNRVVNHSSRPVLIVK